MRGKILLLSRIFSNYYALIFLCVVIDLWICKDRLLEFLLGFGVVKQYTLMGQLLMSFYNNLSRYSIALALSFLCYIQSWRRSKILCFLNSNPHFSKLIAHKSNITIIQQYKIVIQCSSPSSFYNLQKVIKLSTLSFLTMPTEN